MSIYRISLRAGLVAAVVLAALLVLSMACPAWTSAAVKVSDSTDDDMKPQIVSDGAGGAIITWTDYSATTGSDIYSARLDASGTKVWESIVCGEPGQQTNPRIVPDGAGGAIIAWQDDRNGGANPWDIYTQRMNGSGTRLWGDAGLQVTSSTMDDQYPQLTPDGAGGAIIAWQRGTANASIVAAKVTAAGVISWEQYVDQASMLGAVSPQITTDGAGGAIIAWEDDRSGTAHPWDIYAQRMDASGTAQWGANDLQVSSDTAMDDLVPQIISDGVGGAIITWQRGTANASIVAAKVTAAGVVLWEQYVDQASMLGAISPQITTDGAGGAIITWQDDRNGGANPWDIYAQRMNISGTAQWGANDLQVSSDTTMSDLVPQIISDGVGGAIITWQRGTANAFIMAARVSAGTVLWEREADWDSLDEFNPVLASDGENGAIIAWEDFRSTSDWDIYAQNVTRKDFYFAEGYTGTGFQEYLCLGNAGTAPVVVDVTYLFTDGTSVPQAYTVPALSRFTVDVNAAVGADKNVSIHCTASAPFVAERPMYFDYTGGGGSWTGGHDAVGATRTSNVWFFAEGYTGTGFDEWICVLNPGDTDTDLGFIFQTQEAGELIPAGTYTVPAHSRATFKANDLLGGQSYQASLALLSSQPVVAERPMYFNYQGTGSWGWTGGHCVMGVPSLARDYYFAEGYTGIGFEEWLTLQNPGTTAITVDALYQLGSGAPVPKSYNIPASTRMTVYVPTEVGTDQDVSVHLSSASDFLAERPMYFNYQGTAAWGWTGGHCVIGAATQSTDWFFAEGYTGTGFEEWLCIQNAGAAAAQVTITYYPEGGAPMVKAPITVPANSRYTVNVNADAGTGLSLCAGVTSDNPVIVERPMYFNFRGEWTGGHDVVGYIP